MLLAEALSIKHKIGALLVYLLSIVNVKNLFIASGLILELDMLSFRLLTIALISFFTISWTYFTANVLNLLPLFNAF